MKYTYQYRLTPTTQQKITLNQWLRICRFWYNRQLGERFDWWECNRSSINACLLVCYLRELRDQPNYYSQKKQLPILKKESVKVKWYGEELDLQQVPSLTLQEVYQRVDFAFSRFVSGDSKGKRSGKPRFKSGSRFRSLVFEGGGLELHSCSVGGQYLYLKIPKLSIVKVRMHHYLPDGAILKQAQFIKKYDGWYVNLRLDDQTVPKLNPDDIIANWDNSMGLDAVLYQDDYLATSERKKLPSLKSFRKYEARLAKVSKRKANKKKGSKARRKLAKREGREHQKIARARKDHAYKNADQLIRTDKKVFFREKLNLKGLTQKNKPKQDHMGNYLPNGESGKSGLNKSWLDAAFGQFFSILEYIAEKSHRPRRGNLGVRTQEAGALVIEVNPAYSSQLLSYRDEFVFTDCTIREYWDEFEKVLIDRDINSGINLKRVGLDEFPTIKRRKSMPVVVDSTTNYTSKQVLSILRGLEKPPLYA
ncbi:MAG: transposase [Moorea sp. SIO2B7]|nr:transposase [Moorena sp. SIO2B7]